MFKSETRYSFTLLIILAILIIITAFMSLKINEAYKEEVVKNKILQDKYDKLEEAYNVQNKKYAYLETIIKDLDRCDNPIEALGIGYSESRLKRDVKHPTSDLNGIGGIKSKYWEKHLKAKKIEINTLKAIDDIYSTLYKTIGNKDTTLKRYKGTVKNKKSFYRTKLFIKKIKTNGSLYLMLQHHRKNKSLMEEISELDKK